MKTEAQKQELNEAAAEILRENCRDGKYTVPSARLYPFQWNWDSCFSALGWLSIDETRAWAEFNTLFSSQWPSGMVPHIIFHKDADHYFPGPSIWQTKQNPPTSGITQPPVAATIVRICYEACKDKDLAAKAIKNLLPKIFHYHKWFYESRDPSGSGMIAIFHPWESGRDNSAEWDEPLQRVPIDALNPYQRHDINFVDPEHRPSHDEYDRYMALVHLFLTHNYDQGKLYELTHFKVADIGINAILLRASRDLLWLMGEFTQAKEQQEQLHAWIDRQESARKKFWNEETQAFHSVDLMTGSFLPDITSATFLPFYGGNLSASYQRPLINRLEKWGEKLTYLVPSLDPENHKFEGNRYWRGPVWPVVNFLIATGLQESGYEELARRIQKDTATLIDQAGFVEYYNPYSGQGLGGAEFSWTAAVWIAWVNNAFSIS